MDNQMEDSGRSPRGPEMKRLVERLYSNPSRRTLHFNAWWGLEAHKLTVEERAASINHMLDEIEDGRATPVSFDEDFEQTDAIPKGDTQ